ncbi:hypothetical protein CAP36_01815 [Chitinophagaceae bacterium IBVUCB2]|nr:hypothetical protein CAP36_01815 [Chitinophagaceae bacterium IBVUCB2]
MKTIIITGASGNMGQALVKKFMTEGYMVVSTLGPDDPTRIAIKGKNLETAMVDLANEEDARQFVEFAAVKHQNIDAAVLTVGGFAMGKIADTKTADVLKQYKLNFETAYNVARPVFLQMMQQGYGRIFLIGSRPGLDMKNSNGMVAYGLSKSLLFRLAELMNEESKGTNIVTSVVIPSTIDTPQNRKSMPDADFKKWVKPEAIALAIYFHCTEEAASLREPLLKLYGDA